MPATKPAAKGDVLSCEICGLLLVVDEECGCAEAHEVICCDMPMTKRAARTAKAKPKARARAKR